MMEISKNKYNVLNEIAEPNGIVILGGGNDESIPIGELKQAFAVEEKIYNRSVNNLSVNNATDIYSSYIAPLGADTILLHIGESDLDFFENNPSDFEKKYRELINKIKSNNKKCNVVIVSIKSKNMTDSIISMNKELKYIAQSEQCEYYDISKENMHNPRQTKDVVSFVYSLGFLHPLKDNRPMYDLLRIIFCYNA